MGLELVTVEDCIWKFEAMSLCTIIEDGRVVGFVPECEMDGHE